MIIPFILYMESIYFVEEPGIRFPFTLCEVFFGSHSHIYGWMKITNSNRNHYMAFTIANYIALVFLWMTLLKFFSICNNRDADLPDENVQKGKEETIKKGLKTDKKPAQ